jgi:pyruvate dehydrogenase E2 component (dihydrolipoamide acetyltransferase)
MATNIIMPASGQTSEESLIVKWHKKEGDAVQKGDSLFDIETDKATMTIESYADGIVLEIVHQEGESITAGSVVAVIGQPGEKTEQYPDKIAQAEEGERLTVDRPAGNETREAPAPNTFRASPAARRAAAEKNINIRDLLNSELERPLKKADITDSSKASEKEDQYYLETSSIRKKIARNMVDSLHTAPQYTISIEVDMKEVISLREKLDDLLAQEETKITYNDIIMACACRAISDYPLINAVYGDEKITVYHHVNFGLAVNTADGIFAPVVKGAEKLTIKQIAEINHRNIICVKDNTINLQDMHGGTITLSNLGMFRVRCFSAILNPPQSCILAVGEIKDVPIVSDGEIVIRPISIITASFDHRLIDGAYGAMFLDKLRSLLQSPPSFLG